MPLTEPRKISVPSEAPMITIPRRLPNITAPAPTMQPSGATAAIATSAGDDQRVGRVDEPLQPFGRLRDARRAAHDRSEAARPKAGDHAGEHRGGGN